MKTFTISIPKPCHEDWTKMTPNEKGAHCAVCAKTVVDFSKKSDEEIIEVFEKKGKEKVCGRFAPSQLSQPVVSFGNTSSTSRLVKFAYALLLVFGAALFNGADAFGQTVKGNAKVEKIKMGKVDIRQVKEVKSSQNTNCGPKTQGEVAVMPVYGFVKIEQPNSVPVVDTIVYDGPIQVQSIIETKPVEEEIKISGEVDVTHIVGQSIISEKPLVANISHTEIVSEPTKVDTTITLKPVEIIEPYEKLEIQNYVMGMMVSRPIVIEEEPAATLVDTAEVKSTTVAETINAPVEIEIKATPNPSTGNLILSYNLETQAPVQIDLYDITGKRVKVLTQQGNQYAGKYNISFNISDLPNGIYIATLLSGEKKSNARIILAK